MIRPSRVRIAAPTSCQSLRYRWLIALVAAVISSLSFLLNMAGDAFLTRLAGNDSLLRQFLQAQPDELRRLGFFACAARGRGDRGRRLRLAVAEIDQCRDHIRYRAGAAGIVDRAGKAD